MLNTDIIASCMPQLLSKKSMKKANMTFDFKIDHAVIFDQLIQLLLTKSGKYAIPINPYKTVLKNKNNKSKNNIAIKLHR